MEIQTPTISIYEKSKYVKKKLFTEAVDQAIDLLINDKTNRFIRTIDVIRRAWSISGKYSSSQRHEIVRKALDRKVTEKVLQMYQKDIYDIPERL